MQQKFLAGVLLVVLVAIANTASMELKGWASALQKLGAINFYKQNLVYYQAVLQEGIPALNVPPFDPHHTDQVFTIFQDSYENYTNIEIVLNGMNVSDFSYFDINTAELDLDEMKANLSLFQEDLALTNEDLTATAVDASGRVLSCTCTRVGGGVLETTFNSVKQLEVVGTILQVKRFDLVLQSNWVYLYQPEGCTGDLEIVDTVGDLLIDTLAEVQFHLLPEKLNELATLVTIVLDDIFALRNITYEVDSPQHQIRQLGHKLTKETDGNTAGKIISQSRTRADHKDSSKNSKKNPMKMTWTKN